MIKFSDWYNYQCISTDIQERGKYYFYKESKYKHSEMPLPAIVARASSVLDNKQGKFAGAAIPAYMCSREYDVIDAINIVAAITYYNATNESDLDAIGNLINNIEKFRPSMRNEFKYGVNSWNSFIMDNIQWRIKHRRKLRDINEQLYSRVFEIGSYFKFRLFHSRYTAYNHLFDPCGGNDNASDEQKQVIEEIVQTPIKDILAGKYIADDILDLSRLQQIYDFILGFTVERYPITLYKYAALFRDGFRNLIKPTDKQLAFSWRTYRRSSSAIELRFITTSSLGVNPIDKVYGVHCPVSYAGKCKDFENIGVKHSLLLDYRDYVLIDRDHNIVASANSETTADSNKLRASVVKALNDNPNTIALVPSMNYKNPSFWGLNKSDFSEGYLEQCIKDDIAFSFWAKERGL